MLDKPIDRKLTKITDENVAQLDTCGRLLVSSDDGGTVKLLDMTSEQIKTFWKGKVSPTAIFHVGCTGTTVVVVYLQNSSTHLLYGPVQ